MAIKLTPKEREQLRKDGKKAMERYKTVQEYEEASVRSYPADKGVKRSGGKKSGK